MSKRETITAENQISEETHGKVKWAYGSWYYVYLNAPREGHSDGVILTIEESKALRRALKKAEEEAVG